MTDHDTTDLALTGSDWQKIALSALLQAPDMQLTVTRETWLTMFRLYQGELKATITCKPVGDGTYTIGLLLRDATF